MVRSVRSTRSSQNQPSSSSDKPASRISRSTASSSLHSPSTKRSASSRNVASSRNTKSGFVDARSLDSSQTVAEVLDATVNSDSGLFTRPKVVDFQQRRKEKARAARQAVIMRVASIVLVIVLVVAAAYAAFFSPLFELETAQITVSGVNSWVSTSSIKDIAAKQSGKSLLLVSDAALETQIEDIPGVSKATLNKKFPHALAITVKTTDPAAILVATDGTQVAVDKNGETITKTVTNSDGIPNISVEDVDKALENHAVQQALKVLSALSAETRATITSVTAKTQDSITTVMNTGYTIIWGDASRMKFKIAVSEKTIETLQSSGETYKTVDVSAPSRPIVK